MNELTAIDLVRSPHYAQAADDATLRDAIEISRATWPDKDDTREFFETELRMREAAERVRQRREAEAKAPPDSIAERRTAAGARAFENVYIAPTPAPEDAPRAVTLGWTGDTLRVLGPEGFIHTFTKAQAYDAIARTLAKADANGEPVVSAASVEHWGFMILGGELVAVPHVYTPFKAEYSTPVIEQAILAHQRAVETKIEAGPLSDADLRNLLDEAGNLVLPLHVDERDSGEDDYAAAIDDAHEGYVASFYEVGHALLFAAAVNALPRLLDERDDARRVASERDEAEKRVLRVLSERDAARAEAHRDAKIAKEMMDERDQARAEAQAERDGNMALRRQHGARNEETMTGFVERIVFERDQARADLDRAIRDAVEMHERVKQAKAERAILGTDDGANVCDHARAIMDARAAIDKTVGARPGETTQAALERGIRMLHEKYSRTHEHLVRANEQREQFLRERDRAENESDRLSNERDAAIAERDALRRLVADGPRARLSLIALGVLVCDVALRIAGNTAWLAALAEMVR